MGAWFVGKVLPGLATSGIWGVILWLSHRRLGQRIDTAAARQNDHFDQITASQTHELTGHQRPGGTQ